MQHRTSSLGQIDLGRDAFISICPSACNSFRGYGKMQTFQNAEMITFLLNAQTRQWAQKWGQRALGNSFIRTKVFNQIFAFPSVSAGHSHG